MFVETALSYLHSGLCILPARLADKRPSLSSWKPFQSCLPNAQQIQTWFNDAEAICILCGEVSGHVEMIDFDNKGELFDAWHNNVCEAAPDLLDRLVIETTQNGGYHVAYRFSEPVCGNIRLAERAVVVPDDSPVLLNGKTYKPRKNGNGWEVVVTLIETRGQGGLFLCAPSPGYALKLGKFENLPVLTPSERDVLLSAAYALNERMPQPEHANVDAITGEGRPGDEFNQRGDVRALLRKHGWTLARSGENEHWSRPGKERGTSATLKNGVLYVFTSNAAPFEQNKAYSPFSVYTLLEHSGNFSAAASMLRTEGFGGSAPVTVPAFKPREQKPEAQPSLEPSSLRMLVHTYPAMRAPVIDGMLREGETMNVISAPKIGKSWLVIDLALAISTGRPWLGIPCVKGDVLIVDNELHGETSANRIPKVIQARQIPFDDVADHIHVLNLRGRLRDLYALGPYFQQFKRGRYKAVILDAFYRFLPAQSDENDNGTMANLYNYLDACADAMQSCFILIHHTSKGNQSAKDVTDVGAGAGAQSRATDTHLVLRHHEEKDVVVMDAAVRSWPPRQPRCLRWAYPVWHPDDALDPALLRQEGKRRPMTPNDGAEDIVTWTPETFATEFIAEEPRSEARIHEYAEQSGLSMRRVKRLLELAEEENLVYRWIIGQRKTLSYAAIPQPAEQRDTSKLNVKHMLQETPELTNSTIATKCGVGVRYVQCLRKELKAQKCSKVDANSDAN